MHKNIMILGTASSAGKSLITTALCRIFYEDGFKVTPFKSQNMSLNSFVTKDGLEMGRAQVVQAEACGMEPEVFMNPILLKPNSDNGSQVIVMGKALQNMKASDYFEYRKVLRGKIEEVYENIKENFDMSVIEGAGSPAEINLNKDDIVNIGMAKIAKAPCILVAAIDKGGVFVSIYGTVMLLSEEDRSFIKGIIINKFRGDIKILELGLKMIEDLVNIPVLGVMPYFQHNIEEEDSASEKSSSSFGNGAIKINVIKLPHMSNFNDLDPFKMYPECQLKFVTKVEDLENSDLIIIPGSKNSISDLNYLKNNGFFEKLEEERNKNTLILGICGGLQILGNEITDPYEIESSKNTEKGLGFLDISTILEKEKTTTQFFGKSIESIEVLDMKSNFEFSGYEIHQGVSKGKAKTFLKNESQDIGFVNGNVIGTYLHGVFEEGNFLKVILDYLKNENQSEKKSFKEFKEKEYNKLSRIARESLDMNKIYEIMGIKNESDL